MVASIAMENDELVVSLDDVEQAEMGRAANIEIELLRKLTRLRTFRGLIEGKHFQFRRDKSTMADYEVAKDVLRGFCLWSGS